MYFNRTLQRITSHVFSIPTCTTKINTQAQRCMVAIHRCLFHHIPRRRVLALVVLPSSAAALLAYHQCQMSSSSMAATSASFPPHPGRLAAATQLLKEVYGDWDEMPPSLFPMPMPASEAGPSAVAYGDGTSGETQRRYLWTDAWGVLCLSTLALRCGAGEENHRARILRAGGLLIDAVHATLGQPRGPNYPMLKAEDAARMLGPGAPMPATPHCYIGLRIGKERARPVSDAGMAFDGLYAHYEDKWMFALLRFGQTCGRLGDADAAEKYLTQAEQLIKAVHPWFMQHDRRGRPMGLYWKVCAVCYVLMFICLCSVWPSNRKKRNHSSFLRLIPKSFLATSSIRTCRQSPAWSRRAPTTMPSRGSPSTPLSATPGSTRPVSPTADIIRCAFRPINPFPPTPSPGHQQAAASLPSSASGRRWTASRAITSRAASASRRIPWATASSGGSSSGLGLGPKACGRGCR